MIAAEFAFPRKYWELVVGGPIVLFLAKNFPFDAGGMASPNVMDASRVQFAGEDIECPSDTAINKSGQLTAPAD